MNDMRAVIIPKSDQINADDLLSGPITVTVAKVTIKASVEQPVSIALEGNAKVFRPCKSMCRVMVIVWGQNSDEYVGRSMTLYNDPGVKWGGMKVGGIRISHMSHITSPQTMAITETKGSKKIVTVQPLAVAKTEPTAPRRKFGDWLAELQADLDRAATIEAVQGRAAQEDVSKILETANDNVRDKVNATIRAALDRVRGADADDITVAGALPTDTPERLAQMRALQGPTQASEVAA